MRSTNRSHRISMARKKKQHPINVGLLSTGIDQYKKGGAYCEANSTDIDERQISETD